MNPHIQAPRSCLAGGGAAGERLRATDWSVNPLGPVAAWPLSLQAAVRIVLSSKFPMMLHWGPDLVTIYNDAYAPSLGHKHPGNLGRPAREWWSEMWDELTPIFDRVLSGEAFYVEDARYTPDRDGEPQEAFFTHCHSPLWDDEGRVAGIFLVVTETTARVVAERELSRTNGELLDRVEAVRASEARLRAIVGTVPVGIVMADERGAVYGGNARAEQIFGHAVLRSPDLDAYGDWIAHHADGRRVQGREYPLARVYAGEERPELECLYRRGDGREAWVRIIGAPVLDGAGGLIGGIVAVVDIDQERRAAERLSASEAHWRGLFERLNEGFMVVEMIRDASGVARTWRFVEANDAWDRISGLSRASAMGRAVDDVIPGVEQDWLDRYIAVAETGEPQAFRMPLRVLHQIYDVRAFRVAPDRVGVLFQEVSRQQREEMLRSALLRLADRLHELSDPAEMAFAASEVIGEALRVARVGYATMSEDGEALTIERDWTAPGFASGTGLHRASDYGRAVSDLRDGDAVVIADTALDPRTARDGIAGFDAYAVRALVNLPLIEQGRMVAFFYVNDQASRAWTPEEVAFIQTAAGQTRVATERRRIEGELRRLAASLEQQVERRTAERDRAWRLSQQLLVTATQDGVIVSVNPVWTRLLGWTAAELVGTSFAHYTHPDDLAATLQAFASVLERPLAVPYEYRFRHKDGAYHWFAWTGAFEDGLVYATGRDLKVEREQAEVLRQAQKMEAVGQLTGGVAHDFNNHLTVIRSSADLLKRADLPEERRRRYVAAISDTADRAAKLTGQLLAFARRQALKPEIFDACASVRALLDMMATLTGSRIKVTLDLPDGGCFVVADPSQFDTALVNMAVNARDAMDGVGLLTIAVREVDGMPAVRADPSRQGPFVAITLADTGTGIPADRLDRIFEPFYTTKDTGKGTGLGLSQVFGFTKQSGGEVTVASVVGKGTAFTLYVPRVAAEAPALAAGEPAVEMLADGHGTRVLVVEDNDDVGTSVEQALADLGYVTVLARSAEEGLAELARDPDRFDVVFTDVMMPGMNGIDLGHEIRRLHGDLPVVLTSGYSLVLAQEGTHGFDLLRKPYSAEQLSRILRGHAGRKTRTATPGAATSPS